MTAIPAGGAPLETYTQADVTGLARVQEVIRSMRDFVDGLELPAEDKARLRELVPGSYTGLAEQLARAI